MQQPEEKKDVKKEIEKMFVFQGDKLILKKNFKSISVELETEKGIRQYLLRRTSKDKLILV